MNIINTCDVCGAPLEVPAPRFVPWEVIVCGSPECMHSGNLREIEARKEWRDQMVQDQGLPVDEDNSDG